MAAPTPEQVGAITDMISKLTLGRIAIAIVFLVFGGLAYSSFENRQTLFTLVIQNPFVLSGLAVGALMCAIGWVISVLVQRNDELNQFRLAELSERLRSVEAELRACRDECKSSAAEMHEEILLLLRHIKELGGTRP